MRTESASLLLPFLLSKSFTLTYTGMIMKDRVCSLRYIVLMFEMAAKMIIWTFQTSERKYKVTFTPAEKEETIFSQFVKHYSLNLIKNLFSLFTKWKFSNVIHKRIENVLNGELKMEKIRKKGHLEKWKVCTCFYDASDLLKITYSVIDLSPSNIIKCRNCKVVATLIQ